jgi:hypothetical protein
MRTPKQIAASRANGARSKGPVTAQGKRNSSRNSIRHGLLAESVVLREEDKPRFLAELNELIAEHEPATPTEHTLVETIHVANWRRSRIWGMQKENFDHDVASSDVETDSPALCAVLSLRSSPDSIRSHELLLRYEVAFDRQMSRALLRLQKLQEKREGRNTPAEPQNSPYKSKPSEPGLNAEPTAPQPVSSRGEIATSAKRTQQPIEKSAPIAAAATTKHVPLSTISAVTRPPQQSIHPLHLNRTQKL